MGNTLLSESDGEAKPPVRKQESMRKDNNGEASEIVSPASRSSSVKEISTEEAVAVVYKKLTSSLILRNQV
jgi:hypothetical protein